MWLQVDGRNGGSDKLRVNGLWRGGEGRDGGSEKLRGGEWRVERWRGD